MRPAENLTDESISGTTVLGTDDQALVQSTVTSCIEEAAHALDGAIAVLRLAGLADGPSAPIRLLLKVAACFRLYEWERASIRHLIRPPLPSSHDAWQDLLTAPRTGQERFPDLAKQVFGASWRHLAWPSRGTGADVIVSNVSATAVIDELAELLLQFRHLVDEHRPSGPEEDIHG